MKFPSHKKSITLIGMPGVGKSFIGRNLAKVLKFDFIDTDDVIEQKFNKPLQQLLDEQGEKQFIALESQTIIDLHNIQQKIISPGGSVVYSPAAMEFLKNNSVIIYLADDKTKIIRRIKNLHSRGIVGLKAKGFSKLYAERENLYKKFSDFTIDMSAMQSADKELKAKQVISQIQQHLQ